MTAADLTPAKPAFRGWLHAGMTPVVLLAGIALIIATPAVSDRVGAAVWLLGSLVLFGTSAVYHRGTWTPRVLSVLQRLDHSNIFVFIAATYTPLTIALLDGGEALLLLSLVWGIAIAGVGITFAWPARPRWLDVALYVPMGWVALGWLGAFWASGGPAVVILLLLGGVLYTAGAAVYATRRPNPSPLVFGYHEIFHACTVAAAACHFASIALAILR